MRKTLPRRPRKPFGQGENFLVTGTGRYTTFDARHVCSPCSSVNYKPHAGSICATETHIGLMHSHCTTQMALVLGGLLGQDVTLEGLTALDGTTGTKRENASSRCSWSSFWACRMLLLVVLVRRLHDRCRTLLAPSHFYRQTTAPARHCTAFGHTLAEQALKSFRTLTSQGSLLELVAALHAGLPAGLLAAGAIIMIIWRPSSLGNCSTEDGVGQLVAQCG